MDQPERMNLIRIDVQLRCSAEQAETLVGEADHVAYGPEEGVAQVHSTEASPAPLTEALDNASNRVAGWLGYAGLEDDALLEVTIKTEALIEDGGVWRQRSNGFRVLP